MRRSFALPVLLVALSACVEEVDLSDQQLEDLSFQIDQEVDEGTTATFSGTLAVSGEDSDYTLQVEADGAPVLAADVHTPGGLNLSTLAGREVSIDVVHNWDANPHFLAVSDASGLAYVLNPGAQETEIAARFGEGFADWGSELGRMKEGDTTWIWRAARFETDDGAVELEPGQVEPIVVGGVRWQVAVVAAYQREYDADALLPGCGPPSDLLSYELLRVNVDVEPALRSRAPGASMAMGAGCSG